MIGAGDEVGPDSEGVSIAPLMKGRPIEDRAIYWHFPHYSNHGMQSPGGAIRLGQYKLLDYFENDTVQLFDLENDIGEQNDLSESQPDRARELKERLNRWRKSCGARMMKHNPNFDPELRAKLMTSTPMKTYE